MTLPALAPEDYACASCGLAYPEIGESDVPDRIRAVVRDLRRAIETASADALRRHVADRVWSPLEYLCHVRDVYVTFTIRLYRVRTEDSPAVEPMFNDLRTERFRHNEADPAAVLGELDLAVEGFADEHARVRDWDRTCTRRPGEERTARWLVRQALHEGVHHLADIRAGLASV